MYLISPTFPSHSSPDRVAVNYIRDQIIQWVNRIETDFGATSREFVLVTHWSRSLIQNVVIYALEGTLPENIVTVSSTANSSSPTDTPQPTVRSNYTASLHNQFTAHTQMQMITDPSGTRQGIPNPQSFISQGRLAIEDESPNPFTVQRRIPFGNLQRYDSSDSDNDSLPGLIDDQPLDHLSDDQLRQMMLQTLIAGLDMVIHVTGLATGEVVLKMSSN